MKEKKAKSVRSADENSSNPYAEYIESIESSSSSSSSSKRSTSEVPTPTPSLSHGSTLDFSIWKDKNTTPQDDAFDLVSARKAYELSKTPEQKSALKDVLQPIIVRRLEKLSEMEQRTGVGDEIADAVDFLVSMNPLDPRFVEMGKISETSRKGVISLQKGVSQLKDAQDKLLSQLRSLSLRDNH